MNAWIRRALLLLCLALVVVPVGGATNDTQSDAADSAQFAAGDTANSEGGDAEDPAAQEPRRRIKGGFFSSILEFFRGETPQSQPEREQNEQARAEPLPDPTREPEENPDSHRTAGVEAEQVSGLVQPEEHEAAPDSEVGREAPAPSLARNQGEGEIIADHAYRATADLIAEIQILREIQGIADLPAEPGMRENETALSTYIKSREVMEKMARVQRRLGMIPVEVPPVPVKNIVPRDIYRNVQAIVEEVHRVKRQLVIKEEIRPASIAGGATLTRVYENLEYASSLLDGLVARPTTSNDVYIHVVLAQDEVTLIAARLGVALDAKPPAVEGEKQPKEVAEQVLRAVYKTVHLQSRLGMEPSNVPGVELSQVTPADVFDATNVLLAEVMRVKAHLNIQSPPVKRRPSRKKQSSDTFARLLLILEHLDALTKTASDSG